VEWALAITAVSIIAVVVCSNLLINTPVTPTMVFVAVGLLAGPLVLGDIDPSTKRAPLRDHWPTPRLPWCCSPTLHGSI
jgi:hypothetical protein